VREEKTDPTQKKTPEIWKGAPGKRLKNTFWMSGKKIYTAGKEDRFIKKRGGQPHRRLGAGKKEEKRGGEG